MQYVFAMILAVLASYVAGHPRGAPITACNTMYPLHKHDPQNTPCPFETQPLQTEIFSDSKVKISLHATALSLSSDKSSGSSSSSESGNIDSFKGYMIMAYQKYAKNRTAIGTFEVTHGSHTIDCHGMLNSAATHSNNSPRNIVHITWIPPSDFEGDVVFKTTYVASKKLFWIEQYSVPVHVKLSVPLKDKSNVVLEDISPNLMIDSEDVSVVGLDNFSTSQYISLWAICSFFILGFSCAVVTKLLTSRSKKYVNVQAI